MDTPQKVVVNVKIITIPHPNDDGDVFIARMPDLAHRLRSNCRAGHRKCQAAVQSFRQGSQGNPWRMFLVGPG